MLVRGSTDKKNYLRTERLSWEKDYLKEESTKYKFCLAFGGC